MRRAMRVVYFTAILACSRCATLPQTSTYICTQVFIRSLPPTVHYVGCNPKYACLPYFLPDLAISTKKTGYLTRDI